MHVSNEYYNEVPSYADVAVSIPLARTIIRLWKAVVAAKAYKICVWEDHPNYCTLDEDFLGSEADDPKLTDKEREKHLRNHLKPWNERIECSLLYVNDRGDFWWECTIKHTDVMLETDSLKVQELEEWLKSLKREKPTSSPNPGRYGLPRGAFSPGTNA